MVREVLWLVGWLVGLNASWLTFGLGLRGGFGEPRSYTGQRPPGQYSGFCVSNNREYDFADLWLPNDELEDKLRPGLLGEAMRLTSRELNHESTFE